MRTIYFYLYMVITMIALSPKMLFFKKKKNTMPSNEFAEMSYVTVRNYAMRHLKICGAKIHLNGLENIPHNRAALFVSNHQGLFDIAIFLALIPTSKGVIAKAELKKIPILRTWMEYINCVFMDRKDLKKSAKAILDGVEILKSGYSMLIFPEGTRSRCDTVADFKAGSFKLATKAKVPIVPVTIDGTYKLMEANGGHICPADVRVQIHPAIETAELSPEDVYTLPERVRKIICSSLPVYAAQHHAGSETAPI